MSSLSLYLLKVFPPVRRVKLKYGGLCVSYHFIYFLIYLFLIIIVFVLIIILFNYYVLINVCWKTERFINDVPSDENSWLLASNWFRTKIHIARCRVNNPYNLALAFRSG